MEQRFSTDLEADLRRKNCFRPWNRALEPFRPCEGDVSGCQSLPRLGLGQFCLFAQRILQRHGQHAHQRRRPHFRGGALRRGPADHGPHESPHRVGEVAPHGDGGHRDRALVRYRARHGPHELGRRLLHGLVPIAPTVAATWRATGDPCHDAAARERARPPARSLRWPAS